MHYIIYKLYTIVPQSNKSQIMITKNITLNVICITALLMSHNYVWNMEENPCRAIIPYFDLKKVIKKYNEEYNINNSPLVGLDLETLEAVLAKIPSLDDAIKTALALRVTCKTFYELPLEHFSKAYKHHDLTEKNRLLTSINYYKQYYNKICKSLILTLAGTQDDSLIVEAIRHDDIETINILFEKNAVFNQTSYYSTPIFCFATKPETLKTLIENGVNLNQEVSFQENVLWYYIRYNPSSKLFKFCLDNHVNATAIDPSNGDCLLHFLVNHPLCPPTDINDYVKIGVLLLEKVPHLINKKNHKGKTPIDAAQEYNKNDSIITNNKGRKANKQLITLFKQHGGKTAKQLKKDQEQYQQLVCQIKEFSHHDYSKE